MTDNDDRQNAIRHFSWIVMLCYTIGTKGARAMASAHELNVPEGEKDDSDRDKANNKYSFGYYSRHKSYIADNLGRIVGATDIQWLLDKGNSLYDRGYLWKTNKKGKVVKSP